MCRMRGTDFSIIYKIGDEFIKNIKIELQFLKLDRLKVAIQ